MSIDEKYKLSTYKEISVLLENSSKKICIVKNEVTNNLYVKKILPGMDYFNFYVRVASLKHKNLIEIHDVICSDGVTYVFEEFINGQTLQALLENEGIQPESKVVDYIMQVCDALIYLHGQDPPIIHRDIKPENIMLSADNVIKLVDFDIAREFKQSAKRDTTFMGTKEYAAPEQYGYKQTDGRTDIYAIGVLLHEMLTGKLPENNINYKGALQKIILKCLRLEPAQRYRSVSALKKALANTRFNRYKKLAIYVLSGIAVIIFLFPKISDYLYNLSNTPSVSMQTITEQNFDDVADLFVKVNAYEEKPTIILEQETVNKIIRSITGTSYDSVARAFQEYDDSFWKVFYDPDINLLGIPTCNFEDGVKHDRLLLEISGEYMNITFYDSDLETTFYFTTNDDKGLLSENAFNWIKNHWVMFENPVVFNETPITDITGTYYVSNQKKIEIFEEAGEMKFSYTDIRRSEEAEPWIVETIHKLDDNHYWIKTFTGWNDKEMLIFNFSENHLTLLNMLEDSGDLVYDIAGRGVKTAIDPKGIYDKVTKK